MPRFCSHGLPIQLQVKHSNGHSFLGNMAILVSFVSVETPWFFLLAKFVFLNHKEKSQAAFVIVGGAGEMDGAEGRFIARDSFS